MLNFILKPQLANGVRKNKGSGVSRHFVLDLSISHFGMFSENAEEAFVGAFEDVIWHVIVEIGPESLGDETLAIDLVEEVADAVGCIGGAAMPGLAAEEVEVSRFHVQGFGATTVEGWIFWIVGLPARVVATRARIGWAHTGLRPGLSGRSGTTCGKRASEDACHGC